jgi:hypothetical protein
MSPVRCPDPTSALEEDKLTTAEDELHVRNASFVAFMNTMNLIAVEQFRPRGPRTTTTTSSATTTIWAIKSSKTPRELEGKSVPYLLRERTWGSRIYIVLTPEE